MYDKQPLLIHSSHCSSPSSSSSLVWWWWCDEGNDTHTHTNSHAHRVWEVKCRKKTTVLSHLIIYLNEKNPITNRAYRQHEMYKQTVRATANVLQPNRRPELELSDREWENESKSVFKPLPLINTVPFFSQMSYTHLICCLLYHSIRTFASSLIISMVDACTTAANSKITLISLMRRLLFVCLSVACYYFVFIHRACVCVCLCTLFFIPLHHAPQIRVWLPCVEIPCVNSVFLESVVTMDQGGFIWHRSHAVH